LATMLTHLADNGVKSWFTEESTYKP
jgi:hypothetical protein